ncbi:MAG: hypothetical protein JXP34_26155 [Planctomycetes bacterium]|nr:hypothetical protein [Planctomycetota bacterium]
MDRQLRCALAVLVLLTAAVLPAGAAETPAIRIVPADDTVAVGEDFSVDLILDNPSALAIGGFQCFIEFDRALIEATGGEAPPSAAFPPGNEGAGFVAIGPWPGSGFPLYPLWSDGEGIEAVAALGFALPGVSEPVTDAEAILARFHFHAIAPAASLAFGTDDLAYPVTTGLVGADGLTLETGIESLGVRIVSVARPADLACAADGTDVALTWSDPQAYDGIIVKRDGAILEQIDGAATSFRDEGTETGGSYAYEVIGMVGLERSPAARCAVAIGLPAPTDVTCVVEGDRILLSWTPADAYTGVSIARGGEVIAVVTDGAQTFIDAPTPALDPVTIQYVLVAIQGENTSAPVFCATPFASPRFVRGDADGDGALGIGDAIRLLSHLFTAPDLACEDAADFNDGGTLDLGDAVGILNYVFASGSAPAAPYPDPGIDATADTLTCAEGL